MRKRIRYEYESDYQPLTFNELKALLVTASVAARERNSRAFAAVQVRIRRAIQGSTTPLKLDTPAFKRLAVIEAFFCANKERLTEPEVVRNIWALGSVKRFV